MTHLKDGDKVQGTPAMNYSDYSKSYIYFRNFPNAPLRDAWYPMPLAEKIAGRDYNSSRTPYDITISYNTKTNWNYTSTGLSGNQFDFITVILHEILHGLGFASSAFLSPLWILSKAFFLLCMYLGGRTQP